MKRAFDQTTSSRFEGAAILLFAIGAWPTGVIAQSAEIPDFSGNWQLLLERFSCGEWNVDQFGQQRTGLQHAGGPAAAERKRAGLGRSTLTSRSLPCGTVRQRVCRGLLGRSVPNQYKTGVRPRGDLLRARRIPAHHLDGWPRTSACGRTFLPRGHSIGWYEGDTLVVETANLHLRPGRTGRPWTYRQLAAQAADRAIPPHRAGVSRNGDRRGGLALPHRTRLRGPAGCGDRPYRPANGATATRRCREGNWTRCHRSILTRGRADEILESSCAWNLDGPPGGGSGGSTTPKSRSTTSTRPWS